MSVDVEARDHGAGPRRSLAGLAGPGVLVAEPDARLVALAVDGDERAFAAIVARYRAPLLRYCRRILEPSSAEDALQQTFINAHAALARARTPAPVALRPWLYRIAHNAALNIARDPQLGLSPVPESLDGPGQPGDVVEQRADLERVVGAMKALPEKQREVIVRHELGGDSHERIAADLGMSAGAVRQLAYRARAAVRSGAAALVPEPILRLLPWLGSGPGLAEGAATGTGAAVATAAAALLVAGAGGGAIHTISTHHPDPPRGVGVRPAPERLESIGRHEVIGARPAGSSRVTTGRTETSGSVSGTSGSSGPGSGTSGSSGPGSGSGGSSGSSGSGSATSGASSGPGSGSSGSGSGSSGSGRGSSGSSGSGSGSSGSGSGSSGSGSGSSGSSGSGSGTSAPVSGTSGSRGPNSGMSGTSGTSGSGSGTSGTSGSSSGSSSGTSGSSSGADPSATAVPVDDHSGHG